MKPLPPSRGALRKLPPRLNPSALPVTDVKLEEPPSICIRQARGALQESKALERTWTEGNPLTALKSAAALRHVAALWMERAQASRLADSEDSSLSPPELARRTALLGRGTPYVNEGMVQVVDLSHVKAERSLEQAAQVAGLTPSVEWSALAQFVLKHCEAPPLRAVPSPVPLHTLSYRLRENSWSEVMANLEQLSSQATERAARPPGERLRTRELKGMTRWRYLKDYGDAMPGLLSHLARLRAGDVWADVGGGNFNACADYLRGSADPSRPPGLAQVLGLDLKRLGTATALEQEHPAQFQFIEGNVTALPVSRGVDVITDYVGALSYDSDPAAVMQRYAQMLRTGGRLYVVFNEGKQGQGHAFLPANGIVGCSGEPEQLGTWLAALEGFASVSRTLVGGGQWCVVLEKVSDAPVPALRLIGYESGTPPRRVFATPARLQSGSVSAAITAGALPGRAR